MANVRVEYLFPNIENKRKLKWLETASFVRVAEDREVVEFSFSEYLYRLRKENIRYNDHSNKDITNEVNQEAYENWKRRSQSNIFELNGGSICFDNRISQALAEHLASHPLEIPYFLESNAINIVGLFLGKSILFSDMNLASYLNHNEYDLWYPQTVSENDYRRKNFEAKYQLSLFLSVIGKLLEMGMNLEEFSFVDLRECRNYQDTAKASLWNEKLIASMDVSSYKRSDGQKFSEKEMRSFLSFSTLSEFLTCIMNLVEVEYYVNFIEEAVTMNPSELVALPKFCLTDFSFLPSEKLVGVRDLCLSFQERLKKIALETEVKILERKLEELRKALNEKEETSFDDSKLREQIEWLYQEILKLSTEKRKELIRVLKQILENSKLSMNLGEDSQLDATTGNNATESSSKKKEDSALAQKVQELDKRVESLEDRVSSLEDILKEYLEHGGVIPNLEDCSLSKEEIIKLIKEYKPTTLGAYLRKVELLKTLKVGLFAALLGGLLFISGSTETTLKEVDSVQMTPLPTEQVVDPVQPVEQTELENLPSPSPEVAVEEPISSNLKPIEEIVLEVIRGNWGNVPEREIALEAAGYDFEYVQNLVNKVKDGNVPINHLRSIEEVLTEVMNGMWGEGEEREARLTRAGYNYQVIEQLLSEMIVTVNPNNPQK